MIIALAVVGVLLIGADRISLLIAERAAANTIQSAQSLDRAPSVSVAGFPFLTQLATGHFGRVTLSASDLTVGRGGRTARLAKITVDLRGVHVARDLSLVRADTASAMATIAYVDLSHTVGVAVAYGGPSPDGIGRVTARTSVSVAGRVFSASVTAELKIANGALGFVTPNVSVSGVDNATVPQAVIESLRSVFGAPIALTQLPFGLTVRSVTASTQGVRITLTGRDLMFRRA